MIEEKLDPEFSRELYLSWQTPRFGNANPEDLTNPVWTAIWRDRSSYSLRKHFAAPNVFDTGPQFELSRGSRGSAFVELPDGRKLTIGGTQDESGFPDFCVYNLVVVEHPDGRVEFFGYPEDVFLPTSKHTANLVGDRVLIVGNDGYKENSEIGTTPAHWMNLCDLSIQSFPTSGEIPGWIFGHSSVVTPDSKCLEVSDGQVVEFIAGEKRCRYNFDDYLLHLDEGRWERRTHRGWQIWHLGRADQKRMDVNKFWGDIQLPSPWTSEPRDLGDGDRYFTARFEKSGVRLEVEWQPFYREPERLEFRFRGSIETSAAREAVVFIRDFVSERLAVPMQFELAESSLPRGAP